MFWEHREVLGRLYRARRLKRRRERRSRRWQSLGRNRSSLWAAVTGWKGEPCKLCMYYFGIFHGDRSKPNFVIPSGAS